MCRALASSDEAASLRIYSTGDSPDVDEEEFMRVAKPDEAGTFYPTLVLVGTRLGTDRITCGYWNGILASLQMPQSVGIAG
jgi:cysteine protease ATG4